MRSKTINGDCGECGGPQTHDVLGVDAYEELLKDLSCAARTARIASRMAGGLDDKVRFQRLGLVIENARRELRLMLFEFDDAAKLAVGSPCNNRRPMREVLQTIASGMGSDMLGSTSLSREDMQAMAAACLEDDED